MVARTNVTSDGVKIPSTGVLVEEFCSKPYGLVSAIRNIVNGYLNEP